VYCAVGARSLAATLMVLPASWALADWVRGWLFTGFPWLAIGYSQVPASPLAGYAPIAGVYGVTVATVLTSALLVTLFRSACSGKSRSRFSSFVLNPFVFMLAGLWLGGYALQRVTWTTPSGPPISVSLLQGNVSQDMKWREDRIAPTLTEYQDLVGASHARLIVLPETALPMFLHEVPAGYLAAMAAHARSNGGDVLIGVPERSSPTDYFNSVLSFGMAPTQTYRKSHLADSDVSQIPSRAVRRIHSMEDSVRLVFRCCADSAARFFAWRRGPAAARGRRPARRRQYLL
jgi:apolipoprotein N-acyltransferase